MTYCNSCDVGSGSLFRLSRLLTHSQNLNWQKPYSALEFMNTVNTWSSLGLMRDSLLSLDTLSLGSVSVSFPGYSLGTVCVPSLGKSRAPGGDK